jgi:hypothetical protein
LNFIFGIVCLFVCVCAFSLHRESPDMILGDKPLIFEVVLSQARTLYGWWRLSRVGLVNVWLGVSICGWLEIDLESLDLIIFTLSTRPSL